MCSSKHLSVFSFHKISFIIAHSRLFMQPFVRFFYDRMVLSESKKNLLRPFIAAGGSPLFLPLFHTISRLSYFTFFPSLYEFSFDIYHSFELYSYASYTNSPARYVWHTGMSLMVLSSTSNGFWPSTTKSAIIPSAIWPLTFSSKLASALRMV